MGLLEVEMESELFVYLRPSAELWLTRIEFLHRTVMDFLLKPTAQRILCDYTNDAFNAHLFRCNLLMVDVVTSIMRRDIECKFASISCFLRQFQSTGPRDAASFLLFERMVQALKQHVSDLAIYLNNGRLDHQAFVILADFILQWRDDEDPLLSLVLKLGWDPYVNSKLAQ